MTGIGRHTRVYDMRIYIGVSMRRRAVCRRREVQVAAVPDAHGIRVHGNEKKLNKVLRNCYIFYFFRQSHTIRAHIRSNDVRQTLKLQHNNNDNNIIYIPIGTALASIDE